MMNGLLCSFVVHFGPSFRIQNGTNFSTNSGNDISMNSNHVSDVNHKNEMIKSCDDHRILDNGAEERRERKNRGPRQGKDMRVCVVSKEKLNRNEMWRVVRCRTSPETPANPYTIRINEGNGRSVYIKPCEDTIRAAIKRNALKRSLRCYIPDEIYDQLLKMAVELNQSTKKIES